MISRLDYHISWSFPSSIPSVIFLTVHGVFSSLRFTDFPVHHNFCVTFFPLTLYFFLFYWNIEGEDLQSPHRHTLLYILPLDLVLSVIKKKNLVKNGRSVLYQRESPKVKEITSVFLDSPQNTSTCFSTKNNRFFQVEPR
jgi:hypothetical protein